MQTAHRNRSAHVLRAGVTLLEVMISVGVMSIGLMGMASLIPLGRLELAEGNRMDNTSTLGRAAFRELTVQGYLRPEMWVDPTTGQSIIKVNSESGSDYLGFKPNPELLGPPYAPLVIDPLMIAPQQFASTSEESTHRETCKVFPYSAALPGAGGDWPESEAPRLARATLRAFPPNMGGMTLANSMPYSMVQRYFRSNDDLAIDLPTDRARRAMQIFSLSAVTSLTVSPTDGVSSERPVTQVAFRKFKGDYSWFFVVEPSPAEAYSPSAYQVPIVRGPTGSLIGTRSFRAWVVVCNKRDLRPTTGMNLAEDRDVGERMVWVDFIDRNTARLRVHGADQKTADELLDLTQNQWFAALASYSHPVFKTRYMLEWYRIINVADHVQQDKEVWFREFTIAGRDFSNLGFEINDAGSYTYDDIQAVARDAVTETAEPLTARGIIVSGVRGVFEKTIYVDRPSSWAFE